MRKSTESTLFGFRAVYVFDITQTEGKELPTLNEVEGDVSGYRERLVQFVASQGIELNYFRAHWPRQGLIPRRKNHTAAWNAARRGIFHARARGWPRDAHRGDRRTLTTKQVRETEAEALAFVVCQSVGLRTEPHPPDYIQLWHGDANLLRESLEAVQQTAAVILGGIAPEPAALAAAA